MNNIINKDYKDDEIKQKLEVLFKKLDLAYPDKCITDLYNDNNKEIVEIIVNLYSKLGYPNVKTFLVSYGYKYEYKKLEEGEMIISNDGKTLIYLNSTNPSAVIKIPSGIETIRDKAMLYAKFSSLLLPKELKYFDKYALKDKYDVMKKIDKIKVEDGNQYFCSDEYGFYSIDGNNKKLILYTNNKLDTFNVPSDVISFADYAFNNVKKLKTIILSESMEEFNQYALLGNKSIKQVRISANIKEFKPIVENIYEIKYNTDNMFKIYYFVDENNNNLFIDRGLIYQVLPDDKLKLVKCLYDDISSNSINEYTRIIGDYAFADIVNLKEIEIPEGVEEIGSHAFSCSGLRKAVLPKSLKILGEYVFSQCDYLSKVMRK